MKIWKQRCLNILWGIPFWLCIGGALGHPALMWTKEFWWSMAAWFFAAMYGYFDSKIDQKVKDGHE